MQYHPDRGWLIGHGHDPRLAKHVHIPRAADLYAPATWAKHPYCVLHELAHAYHDQVLGFENPEVEKVYDAAKEKKLYDEVLLYTGQKVRHYALTNPKEYFAETTEAYFGVNDFYPFVRAELKEHDPAGFALMETVWGKVR
jgi:dipeptidyl-peptidase-4